MPVKGKVNIYLEEVFKQFVAIQDVEYKKSQAVFNAVFNAVKKCMGDNDNYFQKYGKQVMYAGSVYDGIKVSKLDEFDMDIVIRLPISYKDGPKGIVIENEQPGYVKLKIEDSFDNLDNQKDWENCHKVTRDWRDGEKYLLQNKFRDWMHGIVEKALNDMGGRVEVDGVAYLVTYRESGPAYTLNVKNDVGAEAFALDVDLVPVIKFMLPRWPEGYRQVQNTRIKEWLVVPKPNKAQEDVTKRNRCWRLSFQEFEHEMMKGRQLLKMTIRLVKKLRDALELKAIASYYIKTLFLWKIQDAEASFWERKLSIIFADMVQELRNAIHNKTIRYFWNEKFNLIEGLKDSLQTEYTVKLDNFINCLKVDYVDQVVRSLLTPEEYVRFKSSDFYKRHHDIANCNEVVLSPHRTLAPGSVAVQIAQFHDQLVTCQGTCPSRAKLLELEATLQRLDQLVRTQEERIKLLAADAILKQITIDAMRRGDYST